MNLSSNTEYFITDTIRIFNNKTEFLQKEKYKPVTKRNWHSILIDYGWEKLPKIWITILNKLNILRERNSLYGVLDCETDGNCFFNCIAHSLNQKNIGTDIYYNSSDIRNLISDNLTYEQYDTMINYYRIMKDADDFDECWDPYSIQSIDEFKDKINTPGHEYWGDYLLLQILINTLKMNIFILNSNTIKDDYTIYNTLNEYNPKYNSIFLLYENECHFKLLGHFNGSIMISNFNHKNIPFEFKKLYQLD